MLNGMSEMNLSDECLGQSVNRQELVGYMQNLHVAIA
jgi:hypothetical protein